MIDKKPINPLRIRKITGSFAFIEHRFRSFIKTLPHASLASPYIRRKSSGNLPGWP
ncbi:MAG: hypothetical protein HY879_13120 [Deltaproteobacteria bacterium]|nr:hypothetical protein [Deltaproteobacteria bacterium]